MEGRTATITGHMRDLPLGEIVLQVDYIDFYDTTNGIGDETTEDESEGDDTDW